MFTQLFGSFLLNKKFVTVDHLKDALDYQKTVHVKLGVLAVNSGFMSAEDVNDVHNMQTRVDKKFGELAIEMGFLDELKLKLLLSTQKAGHLLLGQALVDKGYMTLSQFENALTEYKNNYSLTDEQFKSLQNGEIDDLVYSFYNFSKYPDNKLYKDYLSLLIKNIIRFIDDNFTPQDVTLIESYKFENAAVQEIKGEPNLFTCISADENAFIHFACKYANENFTTNDEYVESSVGEFLNLINGLFLVNMSNNNIELELTPQEIYTNTTTSELTEAFCIPISFDFGVVDFIFSRSKLIAE